MRIISPSTTNTIRRIVSRGGVAAEGLARLLSHLIANPTTSVCPEYSVRYYPWSLHSKVLQRRLLRHAESQCERQLRDVKGIETCDIGLICGRDGFLCLNDFQVIGDARLESVLSLRQCLGGEVDITSGDRHELGG